MIVVKELHDVQEKEERLTQLPPGAVSLRLVLVPLGDAYGEGLESLSVRVRRGGGRRNVAELLIQQFQYFTVILSCVRVWRVLL